MSLDFEHHVEIERPATEVFPFLADCENNPRWQSGMQSCRWTSGRDAETGAIEVGATYEQHARFMGRAIDTHFRVTEYVPGQRISIESTVSTFPIQVTRSVASLGPGRCRVTAHIRGQPTGVLKLFSPMVKSSVAKDYRKLKALLTAG